MRSLAILLTVFASAIAFQNADKLAAMVNDRSTYYQLKQIDNDYVTPREQLQQSIQNILVNQSAEVQEAYKMLVDADKMKDEAKYKMQLIIYKNMGAPDKIVDAYKRIYEIENDMSLSKRETKAQIRSVEYELKSQLSPSERRYLNSFSSEEFF
uniref:DUF148 domain-containing protein n=1 Tax=Syphacia muris TaxID=451379 RepID=A0A0N5AQS8_9BILA